MIFLSSEWSTNRIPVVQGSFAPVCGTKRLQWKSITTKCLGKYRQSTVEKSNALDFQDSFYAHIYATTAHPKHMHNDIEGRNKESPTKHCFTFVCDTKNGSAFMYQTQKDALGRCRGATLQKTIVSNLFFQGVSSPTSAHPQHQVSRQSKTSNG